MFFRRPEAPEACGKLQKAPAAHKINFPAAFSASRGSRGAPDVPTGPGGRKNNLSSFGKCFFGARSLALGPPVQNKLFGDGKVYCGVFRSLEAPAGAKNKFEASKNCFSAPSSSGGAPEAPKGPGGEQKQFLGF